MNTIQTIIDDICYLQVKIPEELFKVKEGLEEYIKNHDDFSDNHYVESLVKKNKKLKKKDRKKSSIADDDEEEIEINLLQDNIYDFHKFN